MSVTIYDEGEHGAGFVGVRVAVYVKDTQKQHYASFKDKSTKSGYVSAVEQRRLIKAAKELNTRWEAEKLAARKHRKLTTTIQRDKLLNTHITGMYATCSVTLNGRGYPNINYCINVHAKQDGERLLGGRSVLKDYDTYVAKWHELARELAKFRGLKRIPTHWKQHIWDEKHYNRIKNRGKRLLSKFKQENGF